MRGYEIVCRLSVRVSVTFRYRYHMGSNTSKIISRPSRPYLKVPALINPSMGDLMQREHPKIRME